MREMSLAHHRDYEVRIRAAGVVIAADIVARLTRSVVIVPPAHPSVANAAITQDTQLLNYLRHVLRPVQRVNNTNVTIREGDASHERVLWIHEPGSICWFLQGVQIQSQPERLVGYGGRCRIHTLWVPRWIYYDKQMRSCFRQMNPGTLIKT